MAVFKRGRTYWYEFIFAGKRIRESAKTYSRTVAREAEKDRRRSLERTLAGLPAEKRTERIQTVNDVVTRYIAHYGLNHRKGSVRLSTQRLAHVQRLLGTTVLPDVTEDAVREYIRKRTENGAAGRTVNMELGELSRAIGRPSAWVESTGRISRDPGVGAKFTHGPHKSLHNQRARQSHLSRKLLKKLVGPVGFEPTTNGL